MKKKGKNHLKSCHFTRLRLKSYTLSVLKTLICCSYKGYARSYSVAVIFLKDPSIQLTISRLSIKNLFKDSLAETRGFKYQIPLKALLSKYKNLLQLFSILLLRLQLVLKTVLTIPFNKFLIGLLFGLVKDLVGD